MNLIFIGFLVVAAACWGFYLALRKLTRPRVSTAEMNDWIDMSWQNCRPIERLLDPAEFHFLHVRGLSKQRIKQLRSQRQKLFRLYLRRLTHEFNMLHGALAAAMVQSATDRPDLWRELSRQRMLFYRRLVGVEFRLALYPLGFDRKPALELIRPLQELQVQFRELVPVMAGVQA